MSAQFKEVPAVSGHPHCPFYGMRIYQGTFHATGSNQCALKFLAETPCHMEACGEKPYWQECFYKKNPKIKGVIEKCLAKANAAEEEKKEAY